MATPLRLLSVVRAQAIDLSSVEIVVLDEADKLFELDGKNSKAQQDEEEEAQNTHGKKQNAKSAGKKGVDSEDESSDDGDSDNDSGDNGESGKMSERIRTSFLSQVDEILAQCPEQGVQRALYSATVGPFVKELASSFLNNPVQITIGKENAGASTIDQKLVFVGREDGKLLAIRQIVQAGLRPPVLLFLQSIDRAKVDGVVVYTLYKVHYICWKALFLDCLVVITVSLQCCGASNFCSSIVNSICSFLFNFLLAGAVPRAYLRWHQRGCDAR